MDVKDRFKQTFEVGDTIIFMRSSGNYLEVAGILSINSNGNAQVVEEDGTKSTFLLTRGHRVVKTQDPIHTKYMKKVLEKSLGAQMRVTQNKIKTDLNFLKI